MAVDTFRRSGRVRAVSSTDLAGVRDLVRRLDWVLMLAAAALIGYGLWAVAGVTRFEIPGDAGYYIRRQGIAVAVGVIAFVAVLAVPLSLLRSHWRAVYGATIALMLVVFAVAEANRGSKRWLDLGPIEFQPSEFGKVLFVIAIAGFLADRWPRVDEWRVVWAAVGLAAVPIGLVFLQPDLGTALVYVAALSAALFIAGIRWTRIAALAALAAILVLAVLWALPAAGVHVLKPYQLQRLTGFADPNADPAGISYNVNQSMTAIGAGGLHGRGVTGASQTRFDYVPENHTDFVFASFAEQRGFLGAAVLLLLYLLIVWRALRIVTLADELFEAVVAGAIAFAIVFQVFVNVGMTMGIAPATGIPLPLVTVGGSSVVANLIALGVLQAIHARSGRWRR